MKNLFLLSSALLLLSCDSQPTAKVETAPTAASKPNRPDAQAIFQKYLRASFQQTIPEAEHWYVVIPAFGCKGCNIEELRVLARGPARPQVTVLASKLLHEITRADQQRLAQVMHLLPDTIVGTPSQLDLLQLPFPAYTGLVRTKGGKIQECIPFDKEGYPAAFARLPANAASSK